MFAQLLVYCSALVQSYVTVTGATVFPSYRLLYSATNSGVASTGAADGDCMCLDYCVAALVLLMFFDVSLDVIYACIAVARWIISSVKSTIPCHISTSPLPLRAMVMVTLLAVHPVACLLMIAFMVVVMKLLRIICISVYKPAVHLPHPTVERLIQVRVVSTMRDV
jgi:hypothetical protein